MQDRPTEPTKRRSLVVVAYKHFPVGSIATSIGIAALSGPLLYNLFRDNGFDSVIVRVLLSGAVVGIVPMTILYLVTLARARSIRGRLEAESDRQVGIIADELKVLEAKEQKEEKEVIRLEHEVEGNIKARKKKDEQEDQRWDLLNERLRVQEDAGQQNVVDSEHRESERQEVASDKRIALGIRDAANTKKEDKRWDLLNERLQVQEDTGVQHVADLEQRESERQELASDTRIALGIKEDAKNKQEDKRWDLLNERLQVQEDTGQQNVADREQRETQRQEVASDNRIALGIKEDAKNKQEDNRWDLLNERLRVQEDTGQQNDADRVQRESERQEVASDNQIALGIKEEAKNKQEDKRWDLLNERLQVQEDTGVQNVADREQRESERQEVASDKQIAQNIREDAKTEKDDKRWDLLNERMQVQETTGQQHVVDLEHRETERQGFASDKLIALQLKNDADDVRWDDLMQRLLVLEQRGLEREQREVIREDEFAQMRKDDAVREQYRILFARYVRQAKERHLSNDVADGLAPIPQAWLDKQPELIKDATLAALLAPLNER